MRRLKPLRPVMLGAQGQDLSFQFSRIEHHRLTFFVRESAVLVGEGNELFTDPHEFGYFFPHCHAPLYVDLNPPYGRRYTGNFPSMVRDRRFRDLPAISDPFQLETPSLVGKTSSPNDSGQP